MTEGKGWAKITRNFKGAHEGKFELERWRRKDGTVKIFDLNNGGARFINGIVRGGGGPSPVKRLDGAGYQRVPLSANKAFTRSAVNAVDSWRRVAFETGVHAPFAVIAD